MQSDAVNIFKGRATRFLVQMYICQGPARKEVAHSKGGERLRKGPLTKS